MSTFASMTARLNLDFSGFAAGLRSASAQAGKFAADLNGKINNGLVDPTKKAKFEFKDVARIVQGILISKVFYGGLNSIRSATAAVWEFSKNLEYAKMAYTNLFGDASLANEFINVLKDFAAITPFEFAGAEAAAKRLLAYGIQYKNVMYVMQGVLAASTMQNNPQVIETVSRALGQIYTKGRLMNEEMRQLAEAGIPVYEILAQKLGLTNEELRNLGRTAIPANIAINALVDGINERFGGVLDASSRTLSGIISNIKDNALMLFSGIFEPLTNKIKAFISKIGDTFFELRDLLETGGIGSVFERLIPVHLQETVKVLIANLMNLWSVIKGGVVAAWQMFGQVILQVVQALNILMPFINAVAGLFVALLQAIAANKQLMTVLIGAILGAAVAWLVYKVHALSALVTVAIIKVIIVAVKGLVVALNFLVAHPIWALLAFGVGLLIAFSGAAGKVGAAVRNMFKSFSSIGGVNPDDLLLPSQEERANDIGKFNERLEGTSSAMDDLADSTGAATKAAKGLLSFDEVFKLNQPDEGAGSGGAMDIGDWDIPDLGGLGGGAMPDPIEFEKFATEFIDGLLSALGSREQLLSAGIGALIGSAIGTLIGGPLGAKIGLILGGLAGWFWPQVAEALKLTDVGTIALPISSALGLAIGFIAGGPLGAAIGIAIGGLVGWLIDAIANTVQNSDWTGLPLPIGIGLGAAIGMIAGGPVGAAIGAAVGALVGWIVQLFAKNWDDVTKWTKKASEDLGDVFSNMGAWFGGVGKSLGEFFAKLGSDISEGFTLAISNILAFFDRLGISIAFWFETTQINLDSFFSRLWNSIVLWFSNVANNIRQSLAGIFSSVAAWFISMASRTREFFSSVWSVIVNGLNSFVSSFNTFFSRVLSSITQFGSKAVSGFVSFFSNLISSVRTWTSSIYNVFSTWLNNLWNNVFGKFFSWIDTGLSKLKNFLGIPTTTKNVSSRLEGHASGGVFNREHVARFAEGNKKEAIIPLENDTAMQPFVNAVSNGIMASLMPLVSAITNNQGDQQKQPLYVGTLVADERSLRELNRRMNVIQIQEDNRRG